MKTNTQMILDRFAIGLSGLCAIHCLLTPLLLVLFPSLLALQLDDHIYHQMMVWLVVPTIILAVTLGCVRHKDRTVMLCAALGLVLLIGSAFFAHDLLGEMGEKLITLVAVTVIAYAHWRNYSLCRMDSCEHGEGNKSCHS